MSSFQESAAEQSEGGWSDALLPNECAEAFDPKFILARAVRSEVVSRLKADRIQKHADAPPAVVFGPEQRSAFLESILSGSRSAFDEYVEETALREQPFTEMLRQLITPTLDDLGQMWRDDRASFVEVTLASCRVQTLVCEILGATSKRDRSDELHGSIAFARPAGESHTLGLTVVTECFRIDGWDVMGGIDLEIGDALWSLVSQNNVDVLGLTVGSVGQIEPVAAAIKKAKAASSNPNLIIGVGGYCAIADPAAMESLEADFIAIDALDAIDTAASFLGGRKALQ